MVHVDDVRVNALTHDRIDETHDLAMRNNLTKKLTR